MPNNGFQSLGYLLGGGAKAAGQDAFMQGQLAQANVQHLSAATQDALANAKLSQLKAKHDQDQQDQQEGLADALLKILPPGTTPEQAAAYATVIRSGAANFEGATTGRGQLQTQGFRQTLADPNAAPDVRLGAAEGIQGKPLSPYVQVPSESVDAFNPSDASGAPAANETPLGDAIINQHVAQTAQANAAAKKNLADATNPGGPKAPMGYEWDPNNPGNLMPIPHGPKDPDTAQQMGSRESSLVQRQLNAANQGIKALNNIIQLPAGANTGVTGVGSTPNNSILSSAKSALMNEVAPEDAQFYNAMISGLSRNLATIETAGLAPNAHFIDSLGSVTLRPGDTEFTKMGKLAEARQIIESGLESIKANPRTPPKGTSDFIDNMIQKVQTAIPYTWTDVVNLRNAQQQNPSITLNDVIHQRLGNSPANTQSTGQPALTNSKGWTLHQDAQGNKAYVSPDGKQYEEVQ